MSVAAVILAAGLSTRMKGANKLLAELDGKPLVRHVAEAALASKTRPVMVVTGHQSALIEDALELPNLTFIHNPRFADGLSSSLRTAVIALPSGASGAVILLGDMPRVSTIVIDRLLTRFEAASEAAAIVPVRGGQRGNPVLLARRLFSDVTRLTGDEGARGLLADRAGVIEVAIEDPAIGFDIDTPEALSELRGR